MPPRTTPNRTPTPRARGDAPPTKAVPRPKSYKDLGPPPEDTLAANEWAFGMMALVMWKTATETGLNEKERRAEMRDTAHTMRGLVPQARLAQAEGVVKGSNEDLERGGAGPEMEDAPQLNRSSSEPAARRGRPRKRQTLR